MAAMATRVKRTAEMRVVGVSPKLSRPIDRPPRITVKLSQERKVRSLAKKTLGSMRVGRAMRLPGERGVLVEVSLLELEGGFVVFGVDLPGAVWSSGWEDIVAVFMLWWSSDVGLVWYGFAAAQFGCLGLQRLSNRVSQSVYLVVGGVEEVVVGMKKVPR